MATTADKRAWLAVNGHPELDGGKGRLTRALEAEYDAAHPPADDYSPGTTAADFNGDGQFDRGWVGADDPPDQDLPGGNGVFATGFEDAPPQVAEERPSRPARGRIPLFGRTGVGRGGDKKPGSTRPRRTFKRVSVAPLIEDAYADIAAAFGSIPPMARLLRAQAPLAGVILEPAVKDTVADRLLLQPAARNYERLKVGTGLLGTPAALMAVLVTAPRPTGMQPVLDEATGQPLLDEATGQPVTAMAYEQPTMQHQSAMVSLRFCVRAMADCAGDSMTRVVERAEASEEREQLVNEFIAHILGMKYDPGAAAGRESARDRQAGLKLAGAGAAAAG